MQSPSLRMTGRPEIPCDAIQNDFEKYHNAHPEVYARILEVARNFKSKGVTRYSIKGIMEIVRWLSLDDNGDKIKVSNSFTSRYARLVMRCEPDLKGFFVLRGLTT